MASLDMSKAEQAQRLRVKTTFGRAAHPGVLISHVRAARHALTCPGVRI